MPEIEDNGDGSLTVWTSAKMDPAEWEEDLPPRRLWGMRVASYHEAVVGDYRTRVPRHWFSRVLVQDYPVLLVFIPVLVTILVTSIIASAFL